jgi:hypothetical protein
VPYTRTIAETRRELWAGARAEGVTVGLPHRTRTPIEVRRAERELFFWTARQTIKLVLFAAIAVYVVVSLVRGQVPGGGLLLRIF